MRRAQGLVKTKGGKTSTSFRMTWFIPPSDRARPVRGTCDRVGARHDHAGVHRSFGTITVGDCHQLQAWVLSVGVLAFFFLSDSTCLALSAHQGRRKVPRCKLHPRSSSGRLTRQPGRTGNRYWTQPWLVTWRALACPSRNGPTSERTLLDQYDPGAFPTPTCP
jgi:hypothetical protein